MRQPYASLSSILLLGTACAGDDPAPGETTENTLTPCLEDAAVPVPTLTVGTEVQTVLIARWTTPTAERSRVTYTNGEGRERASLWEDAATTEHEHILWGLVPGSTVTARVEVESGPDTACGGAVDAQVGALPGGAPLASIDILEAEVDERGITAALVRTDDNRWIALYDEAGRTVWAWSIPPGLSIGTDTFRVRLAGDGRSLEYMTQAASADDIGSIVRVGFDGLAEPVVTVPGMHTDFVPLPSGGWGTLGWEVRTFTDDTGATRKLLGDSLLSVTAEGAVTELWNAFDQHAPDLNGQWGQGWYQPDPEVEDWSHVNSITWDDTAGDFLITATFNDGVYRISGLSGTEVWSIGRSDAMVTIPASSPSLLRAPHSVRVTDQGLLVFNRGDGSVPPDSCSNATEFTTGEQAAEVFHYSPESCPRVYYLGESRRHENGNTLSVFSSSGFIEEVDPSGTVLMRLSLTGGAAYGYIDEL